MMIGAKEHIGHKDGHGEAWICLCGKDDLYVCAG
jgi:hypothetical protein